MKVATIIDNNITIQNIYEMYPHVSFPDTGVPDSFLQENNLYRVIDTLPYNPETQIFNLLDKPVLVDNLVYTVVVFAKTEEEIKSDKLLKVRQYRNDLLNASDNYVTIDRWETYSEDKKFAWRQYRQTLRDLPQYTEDLDNILWPVSPAAPPAR
jgi:hypothetical protein